MPIWTAIWECQRVSYFCFKSFFIKTDWTVSFNVIIRISISGMLFVHREYTLQTRRCFCSCSSSVVHVPGVNDIQSSSSTGQNLTQISRQLNQSQVAWTGNRPPFPGQVLIKGVLFSRSWKICHLCAFYKGISNPHLERDWIYFVIIICGYRETGSPTSVLFQGYNSLRGLPCV